MFKEIAHSKYKIRAILFVAMIFSLFLSSFVETVVMHDNTASGLYKTEEEFDMVRIPMMFGGMVQVIAAIFFAMTLMIPRTKYWSFLSAFIALIALYLTLGTMGYWLKPNHFAIAIGYIPSALVVLLWMLNVWFVRRQRVSAQTHKEEATQ